MKCCPFISIISARFIYLFICFMARSIREQFPELRDIVIKVILKNHPEIELGLPSEQLNNFVYKVKCKDDNAFLKVGFKSTINPESRFLKGNPEFSSFRIQNLLLSGEISQDIINNSFKTSDNVPILDEDIEYIVTQEVDGQKLSLADHNEFEYTNSKILEIVKEIDSLELKSNLSILPNNSLNPTKEFLEAMKLKQEQLLTTWISNSQLKYSEIYNFAISKLKSFTLGSPFESGASHGELNFNHIFIEEIPKIKNQTFIMPQSKKISFEVKINSVSPAIPIQEPSITIIDWGKFSFLRFRYFDLAEYLARILIEKNMLDDFILILDQFKANFEFDEDTFMYSLMHSIIGTIYEVNHDCNKEIKPCLTEKALLQIIKSIKH